MCVLFSWSGAEVFVWYLSAFAVDAIHVTPAIQGRQMQLQSGGSRMEVLHWRPPWCPPGREVVDDSRVGGAVSAARKSLDIQRRDQSSPCFDVPYSECRRDSWWLGTVQSGEDYGAYQFLYIGLSPPCSCVCLHSKCGCTSGDFSSVCSLRLAPYIRAKFIQKPLGRPGVELN